MTPLTHKENPNPAAFIGLVIYVPFQFYIYKNVYKRLTREAEFIIDGGSLANADDPKKGLNDILDLLNGVGAHFRIIYPSDYFHQDYLDAFFAKYKALVSPWERGPMSLPNTSHLKKISITYGAGKDLVIGHPQRGICDLALGYGERDTRIFSNFTKAVAVGVPKFDDWFNGTLDEAALSALSAKLDRSKKTILYVPTHSDLCSIDQIHGQLRALARTYNVIVKLHYFTVQTEQERVKKLRHPGILLLEDNADLLILLKLADVVVSDNSSAIFDALLAGKQVVVADFWDEKYLNETHKIARIYRRGASAALTYPDSIEQTVKRDGTVYALKNPDDIFAVIERALEPEEEVLKRQRALVSQLFSFRDGRSGERAAKEILNCANDTSPRSRPLFYHVFENYKRLLEGKSLFEWEWAYREVQYYRHLNLEKVTSAKQHLFGSVVLVGDSTKQECYETVCDLLTQDGSLPSEIIIAHTPAQGSWVRELVDKSRKVGEHTVTYLPISGSGKDLVEKLKEISSADFIAVFDAGSRLGSDHFIHLRSVLKRYPGVGVIQYPILTAVDPQTAARRLQVMRNNLSFVWFGNDRMREAHLSAPTVSPVFFLESICFKFDLLDGISWPEGSPVEHFVFQIRARSLYLGLETILDDLSGHRVRVKTRSTGINRFLKESFGRGAYYGRVYDPKMHDMLKACVRPSMLPEICHFLLHKEKTLNLLCLYIAGKMLEKTGFMFARLRLLLAKAVNDMEYQKKIESLNRSRE